MSYEVLARKYRPQTFSALTGQEHVSRTLQNAIDTGRIAHAFLFTGARGVGKTSTARILARALNCEQGVSTEPCNVCSICKEIKDGTSTDVFEIDGASNTGVDDIRDLRDNVRYLPSRSRYKIFIIDEVHMLTNNAFNALLKTLEEPPPHVKFIFATTEPHKLPITILSRCQRFDFKRVALTKIIARLREIAVSEGITISEAALALIARKGDGSMRDALTAFDQVLAFCGSSVSDEDVVTMLGVVDRRLLAEMSAAIFGGNTQGVLEAVKKVDSFGYSMRQFCQELVDHFRNLLVVRSVKDPGDILDLSESELETLRGQSGGQDARDIQRRLTLLVKSDGEMAHSTFPRLVLEMALLKMASLAPVIPISELLEKIKLMETGAVHTPALPWNTSQQPATVAANHQPTTAHARPALSTGESRPLRPAQGQSGWERFVALVKEKKPMVASILEHGSPLQFSETVIEVGFPEGSYYLTSVRDPDTHKALQVLAVEFNGQQTAFLAKAITSDGDTAPPSLVEKKKNEHELRLEELKKEVSEHPVINAATRIFGSGISEVREV